MLFRSSDGCPDPDNDKDGLSDVEDHCPMDPGLYSPLEHENGCAEEVADADHDLVPDALDKCPNKAETWNGNKDTDGCPDSGAEPIFWNLSGSMDGRIQSYVVGFSTTSRDLKALRIGLHALAARVRQLPMVVGQVSLATQLPPTAREVRPAAARAHAVAREFSILARQLVTVQQESPFLVPRVNRPTANGLVFFVDVSSTPDKDKVLP